MLAQDPMSPPSPPKPPRNVGSRRIFPAMFKLKVLDAYRLDRECKGNQRATARKFNVHRRQIQKWLQCETALRASVADALRYDAGHPVGPGQAAAAPEPRLLDPASRVFKHDARTLKLVAQKLYPSSYGGAIYKGGVNVNTSVGCYVPKEYQLNDTHSGAIAPANYTESVPSLILKESGLKMCGSETVSISNSPVLTPITSPAPARIPARPQPLFTTPTPSPYGDEPYNLVVKSQPTTLRADTPVVAAASPSPLPARVAEIVADSKTSAFSPKRKWLLDSQQERVQTEPLPLLTPKPVQQPDEPKPKKTFYDFSIDRLCGQTKEIQVKTEAETPPPAKVARLLPPQLQFPPPLRLQHRSIPELKTLHFRPDPCSYTQLKEELITVKQESISEEENEEDEQIDVLTTTPCEDKTFDFPLGSPEGKRRSYSVQFKLNVLDAFHHDKDCNQNQRATARKFNINRRQVQKWLSSEDELRICEGAPPCAQCPHHCVPQPPCQLTGYSALTPYPPYLPWMMPSAQPMY